MLRKAPWHSWDIITSNCLTYQMSFFINDFMVFTWDRVRARERKRAETEREKQTSLWAEKPTQGSLLGPWDHHLSQWQGLHRLSHPGAPLFLFVIWCYGGPVLYLILTHEIFVFNSSCRFIVPALCVFEFSLTPFLKDISCKEVLFFSMFHPYELPRLLLIMWLCFLYSSAFSRISYISLLFFFYL